MRWKKQNVDTFMNDLVAEAGDKPICDLDLDKAVVAGHGGVDRIKDAAQPPVFDFGDLSGFEQKCRVRSPRLPGSRLRRTSGRVLRSDLNAHSRQQNAKSVEKRARLRKPNSHLCGPLALSTLTRRRKMEPEKWKKVDITHGEYMSVSAVFQKEGGSKADLAPTLRLVRRCISMGYTFIQWNGFTKRFDVLYLMKIKREEFSKAWELYKEANIGTESTAG